MKERKIEIFLKRAKKENIKQKSKSFKAHTFKRRIFKCIFLEYKRNMKDKERRKMYPSSSFFLFFYIAHTNVCKNPTTNGSLAVRRVYTSHLLKRVYYVDIEFKNLYTYVKNSWHTTLRLPSAVWWRRVRIFVWYLTNLMENFTYFHLSCNELFVVYILRELWSMTERSLQYWAIIHIKIFFASSLSSFALTLGSLQQNRVESRITCTFIVFQNLHFTFLKVIWE